MIMSSVDPAKTNEAGGLQGTAQNLGASLGTALIGSVLIAALTNNLHRAGRAEPGAPGRRARAGHADRREGHPGRAGRRGRAGALEGGARRSGEALADDYGEAQLHGLERAIGAVAIFGLLALWFTRGLPGRAGMHAPSRRLARRVARARSRRRDSA